MSRTHWVMDYETLLNCFIAVFEDVKTDVNVDVEAPAETPTEET